MSQSIVYGASTISVGGILAAPTAIPSGQSLTITIGSTSTMATIQSNGSYSASINIQALSASSSPYSIIYSYLGTANFTAITSALTTLSIAPIVPVITWANPADLVYGTVLSVTQLNATSTIPGNFHYSIDPGSILATGANQAITVTFTPTDTTDYVVTSKTVYVNVTQALPAFSNLTVSQTVIHGQSIVLAGNLAAGITVPSGELISITIGTITTTAVIQTDGTFRSAAIDTRSLTVSASPYTIEYDFAADQNLARVSSSSTTLTLTQALTQVSLASSNVQAGAGQSVTFTAIVTDQSPGSGTPTGLVNFLDGATIIGQGTLTNGQATFSTAILAIGSHPITAVYLGDADSRTSTATATSVTINAASTATIVTASIVSANPGQAVTFTATVSAIATGLPATGTVTFMDGSIVLSTSLLNAGVASITTSNLSNGPNSITVSYSGDSNNQSSTGSSPTVVVGSFTTTSSVTSTVAQTLYGRSVTFTANVSSTASGAPTPTGTVTFLDGTATLGTAILTSGTATFSTTGLTVGVHAITVVYGGDPASRTSTSSPINLTVSAVPTVTIVTSATTLSNFGSLVSFTATVTEQSPDKGIPTGTVTFKDGAKILGTFTLKAGTTTFSSATLGLGTHAITAVYSGDANNLTSTSSTAANLVVKSSALPLFPTPNQFGTHNPDAETAEVKGIYQLVLNRTVDSAGLTSAVAYLKGGGSAGQLASIPFNSDEYRHDVVSSFYQEFLGRTGSTGDIDAGVASLRNGQTTLQLEAFFLSSAEFNALHVSNFDFLQAAYQNILFRAASPQEVTALTTMLTSGTSRGSIIASLLGSTEAKVATVQGDYTAILARAGDTVGVNYWAAALQGGSITFIDVAVAFFNFAEYKARAAQTVG